MHYNACISDLSGCPNIGEWIYPKGTQVPTDDTGDGFYRICRGSNGQVFIRRRSDINSPTGTYCWSGSHFY